MTPEQLEQKLRERFDDAIVATRVGLNGLEVSIAPQRLVEVCRFLRDEPDLDFNFLRCLSAVDWLKDGEFEVVYHLFSFRHRHELVIKVRVPRHDPRVPSVASVWRTANWHEREAYDLMGIVFEGHPDLRRLFMPEGWVGHPLRKDYVHDIERFDDEYAEKIRRGEIR
ncbi:NAD(P)H-quinone oxidoreductase subunit J [bacterium HR17]|jgi:NADH-quinone oxidoreductase subunit C|uniref:NADH-quinone oxidoreductase subunit C n=1 Tax=Candidatus Fervidibacter japonicus TaxID=2035412 RepID=A0A2H5XGC1_9BACT|nr:NAD(P)H-quinone oxidoreductase subunit J [bacterium HR17]